MSTDEPTPDHETHTVAVENFSGIDWKRVGVYLAIALALFLLGLVPMWLKARTAASQRDEIITLLARSDPAAADRLSDLYVSYRQAMTGAQPAAGN